MADEADLNSRWKAMLFGVRRSARYHQRRRSFFDKLARTSNIASIAFGSAAFLAVLKGPEAQGVALWVSAGLAILGGINLVIGSAVRAREHSDFMRKYIELEQRMLKPPTEELLLAVASDRLSIEANEPPVLHVLNCICHNDQLRAEDGPADEYVLIGPIQRLFASVFDFCEGSLKKVGDKRIS